MTTRHKALLIGASDYDEPGIRSLPFVRDDLQRLATALTDRGFQSAEIAEHRRGITLNFVKDQVSRFLREAKRHDTLFILLSGHGQHFQGTDYLIPEDASFQVHPFADSCVPLDWSKQLNECAAAQVVFLIDACREGIEQDSMSPASVKGWSKGKQAAALGRKVAHVYACSPGQFALFVNDKENVHEGTDVGTTPNDSFSLFSRALTDVVESRTHALHLSEFEEAVQQRIAQLHAAYRKSKPLQRIRVATDVDKRNFAVLPGPTRETREHPWVRAVSGHPAWDRCASGDVIKDVCVALASRLAESYNCAAASLRDDPWHDAELAKRVNDRMEFLTSKLLKDTSLSSTEAALLALLPFVSQAFWAQESACRVGILIADETDRTPESDAFRSFIPGYPRLDRRLRRLRQTGATDESAHHIRWWLFHRWMLQQPDVYAPQSLKELLAPVITSPDHPVWVRDALSSERLMRFIKDQRTAPFTPPRPGVLADHEPIAASTRDEHEVRESLVSYLTKTAHALAISPVDLPEVVADHLGISDSVGLPELLATLRTSQWLESGSGRALKAVCQHPAVEIALQEHAQRVDSLLREINQSSTKAGHALAPLSTLPPYANAGRVRPSGNTPANLSSGIRFHLADDRVQELLMGEQLYGDRGLAIRELYQNALDACRYRDTRTTYLRRIGQRVDGWEGLIEFVQGTDDAGRPYLECRDNGIGMGVNELSHTFAQGGARFVDLPEYVEEAADWAELNPPLELHPNSRFGIGVLSYFMLADEITVRTCRLDREGRPGRLLKVTIAGPGNLFRIEDEGPSDWVGTRVRLHLTVSAARQSAADHLASILWVAPYRTRMVHGSRTQEWEPGILRADLANNPTRHDRPSVGAIYSSRDPDLWWTEYGGLVLADGILVDGHNYPTAPSGVIVNLYGRYRPLLSVDRRRMRMYSEQQVHCMMWDALPSLFDDAPPVVTPNWLTNVSTRSPTFADEVAKQAGHAGLTWNVNGRNLPAAVTGFFPPDAMLLPLVTGDYSDSEYHWRWPFLVRMFPAHILRWRLLTLYAAGIGESGSGTQKNLSFLIAHPSDMGLLSANSQGTAEGWYGHAAKPSPEPEAIFESEHLTKLQETGWEALAERFHWRQISRDVTVADVFLCVAQTSHSAAYVLKRLGQLGYHTPELAETASVVFTDAELLHSLSPHHSWLTPGSALSVPQISYSAARAGRSPVNAAARLSQLGFQVPDHPYRTTPWSAEDAHVLKPLRFDAENPTSVDQTHQISKAHVVCIAFTSNRSTSAVVQLLTEAGFSPSAEAEWLDITHDDDSVLLSDELPLERPVPRGQLAGLALRLDRPVTDVARRLTELGFQVPDPLPDTNLVTTEDARLFLNPYRQPTSSWPAEDEPLDLYTLVELKNHVDIRVTLAALAGRLTAIGYDIIPDDTLLRTLDRMGYGPTRDDTMAPDQLYATARLLNSTMEDVAEGLAWLGLTVEPVPDEFHIDIAAQELLADILDPESPTSVESATCDSRIGPISLPALASAAMLHQTTFREAALIATRLGMTHEAEDWFG
ncbi:caspase family protein [Streptomyces solisilvae]|uniref:HD domain-containing protein n=2 Tax=Streptomyces malaysiensis TaxID=92644 RepID=UPI00367F93C5